MGFVHVCCKDLLLAERLGALRIEFDAGGYVVPPPKRAPCLLVYAGLDPMSATCLYWPLVPDIERKEDKDENKEAA